MVTLAGTQNLNEFELHARAVLGLPINEIQLLKKGASSVILAHANSDAPRFEGVENALSVPNSDIRLFGKPTSRPYRRMGVALVYGDLDKDIEYLVEQAKKVSTRVKIIE
jgi:phosphoribosylglycinamide formyltransferase 2